MRTTEQAWRKDADFFGQAGGAFEVLAWGARTVASGQRVGYGIGNFGEFKSHLSRLSAECSPTHLPPADMSNVFTETQTIMRLNPFPNPNGELEAAGTIHERRSAAKERIGVELATAAKTLERLEAGRGDKETRQEADRWELYWAMVQGLAEEWRGVIIGQELARAEAAAEVAAKMNGATPEAQDAFAREAREELAEMRAMMAAMYAKTEEIGARVDGVPAMVAVAKAAMEKPFELGAELEKKMATELSEKARKLWYAVREEGSLNKGCKKVGLSYGTANRLWKGEVSPFLSRNGIPDPVTAPHNAGRTEVVSLDRLEGWEKDE